MARASLALTRYVLDQATDTLTETNEDEEVSAIVELYDPLNIWLGKQKEKGYKVAKLFQQVIVRGVPTPFLASLFDMLDASFAEPYKKEVADWINPVLTDQVIKYMALLLEKEQAGQAAFDQAFIMALLPILTNHLKHINQASQMVGGLNRDNFLDAAGDHLHPAVPLTKNEEQQKLQRQEEFYKKQAQIIFELIFPEGKKI